MDAIAHWKADWRELNIGTSDLNYLKLRTTLLLRAMRRRLPMAEFVAAIFEQLILNYPTRRVVGADAPTQSAEVEDARTSFIEAVLIRRAGTLGDAQSDGRSSCRSLSNAGEPNKSWPVVLALALATRSVQGDARQTAKRVSSISSKAVVEWRRRLGSG